MSKSTVSVKFKCKKCGGTVLELPDNPTDNSIAVCRSCGTAFGRWGDIKKAAVQTVAADVTKGLKGLFKGTKGFKPR